MKSDSGSRRAEMGGGEHGGGKLWGQRKKDIR